jgi:hypothetical protein
MTDRSNDGRKPSRRPSSPGKPDGSGGSRSGGPRSGGPRSGGSRSGGPRSGGSRSDGPRPGGSRSGGSRSGQDSRGRDSDSRRGPAPAGSGDRREITTGTGQLPRWIRDEIIHSAPKERREAAIAELEAGLTAFAEERFGKAAGSLRKAKELAPRSATIREMLGLSAYQLEQWQEALRELRTYRRLTGSTDHMAIELDCQRAVGADAIAIDKTWELFQELGGSREAEDEIRVVYASFLLDKGETERAWAAIKPGRLVSTPSESLLRRWAVAARVSDAKGDRETARRLVLAIRDADPDIPWLTKYDDLLS